MARKSKIAQNLYFLRRMEEKDLPSVIEIENLSYPNPWRPSAFEGEIANRPVSNPYVIVYRPLDRVIGYIIYWRIKREIQISNIAVHPDFRQRGIGERSLRQILNEAARKSVRFAFLEVRPSNSVARALYEKLGFEVLGIRRGYYRNPPEDALVMGKILLRNSPL